jgi:hypothetical protein
VAVDPDQNHSAWFPATDATHVYFTSEWSLLKAELDGSNLEVLATEPNGGLRTVAVDATDVYVANYGGAGDILKVPKTGGTFTSIAMSSTPWGLALDATHVYWSDEDGTVMRVDKDGQNPIQIASGDAGAYGLALDATHVFWASLISGEIKRANLDGTGVTTLATGQTDAFAMVVDATRVYWLRQSGGGIWSVEKTGGAPKLVTAQPTLWAMAIDSSGLYWTAFNKIGRTDLTTMTDTILAASNQAEGIALGSDRVFWCSPLSPVLLYVAK